MKNKIYSCLWFDGDAKEAATFYCSVFEDSAITGDTPLVVTFEIMGKKIMGLNGGPMFKINPSVSFFVTCKTEEETNRIWDRLIEGGKAMMQIGTYPWSKRYGWLQDRYGMTWQISVLNEHDHTPKLRPSFLFTGDRFGRGEEAMNYYTSVFPGSAVTMKAHYPEGDANAGKLLYGECSINGYELIVMDGPGEHAFTFNEAVSLVVDCADQEEIDYYWNALTANGGAEVQCGWLKDSFGVSWQIVPAILPQLMSDPAKAPKVIAAFMKMKKFDIAALITAAE